ncbi:MAG: DUF423 domain-containing protein [Pseudomarimonas sp.]
MRSMSLPAFERTAAAIAALYCSAAIGLGAYAAHAAAPADGERLERASLYLLVHGVAVIALTAHAARTHLHRLASAVLLFGTALFSGSLCALVLLETPATLAPVGGVMLIAGWMVAACALSRHDPRVLD